jgi:hypothetical protein
MPHRQLEILGARDGGVISSVMRFGMLTSAAPCRAADRLPVARPNA